MARIIEKPDGTLVLLVHLSFKPGRDDALIQLIRSAPQRGMAGIVREAIRNGMAQIGVHEPEAEDAEFELPDFGIEL